MAHPHQPVTSSGRKTADTVVNSIGGYLHGLVLENDGTNACNIIVYDNNAAAATGTILAKVALPASSTVLTQYVSFNYPISANSGIYVDVTGTGAAFIVYHSLGI